MNYHKDEMVKIVQDYLIDTVKGFAGEDYKLEQKGHQGVTLIANDLVDLLEKYIDEEDDKPTWNGN